MKKTRLLGSFVLFGATVLGLASCGGGSENKIVLWVGEESYEFYTQACKKYLEANTDFGFTVEVKSQDTGTAAAQVIADATAAADVFTVAHDNIGKLVQGKYVKPITNKELSDQINADNPQPFIDVAYSSLAGEKQLYASPYISQSLFLMYDKRSVSDTQAASFEGLAEAAKAKGAKVKGWTVTGTDGFNFSFTVLARNNETKATSLKLFEGGVKTKGSCWFQGDDEVASMKWVQKALKDPNGMMWASDAGWHQDIQNGAAVSVIGGAWHFKTFSNSVGSENVGIAKIPTYRLNDDTAFGTATSGTVMRGGTFSDCKCFMINARSAGGKYVAEQKLIKYLSSKAIQDESFIACDNMPAYKGFADKLDTIKKEHPELSENSIKLARAQSDMGEYGLAQPFINGTLNTYYYSKGGPELYKVMADQYDTSTKKEVFLTDADIQKGLYRIQYIWQHGKEIDEKLIPAELPAEID